MNKLAISLTMFAMALGGCGDDDRPGDITFPDSGPRTDMGPSDTDMGTTGADMGGGPRDCEQPLADLVEINMSPMAMGMLLPRCAAATRTCVTDCGTDQACVANCVMNDMTPGVDVGGGTVLDCNLCFNYQFNACIYDACPSQFSTFLCCGDDNGCTDLNNCPACNTEQMALVSCFMAAAPDCDTNFQAACFASE